MSGADKFVTETFCSQAHSKTAEEIKTQNEIEGRLTTGGINLFFQSWKNDFKEIVKRASALDKGLFPDPIQDIAVAYFDRQLAEDVPVLTDDYAPTDNLLNP